MKVELRRSSTEPEVVVTQVVEDEPLPPLPMREVAPFAEKQRCPKCRFRALTWVFWAGFHNACPLGGVSFPFRSAFYGIGLDKEYDRAIAVWKQQTETFPPHHDITCTRCGHVWTIGIAPER